MGEKEKFVREFSLLLLPSSRVTHNLFTEGGNPFHSEACNNCIIMHTYVCRRQGEVVFLYFMTKNTEEQSTDWRLQDKIGPV